jgi:hypothetical protein
MSAVYFSVELQGKPLLTPYFTLVKHATVCRRGRHKVRKKARHHFLLLKRRGVAQK